MIHIALVTLLTLTPPPVDGSVAFVNARLLPVSGPEIAAGVLVVEDGLITAVGAAADVAIPVGAEVRDMTGKTIMPGLICTHSHVGRPAGGDRSAPLNPEVRVLDAIDVRHSSLQRAQASCTRRER